MNEHVHKLPSVRAWHAFTLIEMLTVIAIIAILAAILLPTIGAIRRRARMSAAKAQIAALQTALDSYSQTFGAYPPDSNESLPSNYFGDMDNPNECMVWFLSRYYSKSASAAGIPWNTNGGWGPPDPQDAETVFARMDQSSTEPFMDFKPRSMKDFDRSGGAAAPDGFLEFLDPWGRPYLYRAYLDDWASVAQSDTVGRILTLTLSGASGLEGVIGKIQTQGFSPERFNSRFDFEGTESDKVAITFSSTVSDPTTDGQFRLLLHNIQGCDVYSLGPNGRTRRGAAPASTPGAWNPVTQLAMWTEVHGTPGDGNDVESGGGNVRDPDIACDDVNNWQ